MEHIERLTVRDIDASPLDALNVVELLGQLTGKHAEYRTDGIKEALGSPEAHAWVIRDPDFRSIVAMAWMFVRQTLTGTKGIIEDVVVHKDYRGKGYGNDLTEFMLMFARSQNMDMLELTSNPDNPARKQARQMYAKHGFAERAGYFRLYLKK